MMPGVRGRVPAVAAAAAAAVLLAAAAAATQAARLPQLRPRPAVQVLTVDQSPGKGDYTTIQAAINAVVPGAGGGAVIKVNPGTYSEKVVVNKSGVSLVGTGPSAVSTVVTWRGPWIKTSQYEFALFVQLQASGFVASRITFQNTLGPGKPAVAARVDGDKAAFYDCRFLSYQDTLLDTAGGRHFYRGCYIEGATDFIFGMGKAFFESCHLHSISDGGGPGAFTAQGREALSDNTGFSFVRCTLTGKGRATSILGRPWRSYARVVFAHCNMSSTVAPVGWDDFWTHTHPESSRTAYFGQYECYGEGSRTEGRVGWAHNHLSPHEAAPFLTADAWVDGRDWLRRPQ